MNIEVPADVIRFVRELFSSCNNTVTEDISRFPAIHEESLDMNLISHFARNQAPVRLPSDWTVRIDAHFIGGGRHFGTWEVADIGLMMVFRKRGRVVRSKLVLLQSKKLYADALIEIDENRHFRRFGLGRLLVTEQEHLDLVQDRVLAFEGSSRYRAYRKGSDQQDAMGHFERRWGLQMHYLLYNPISVPHAVKMPVQEQVRLGENVVGCRVARKDHLDRALSGMDEGYSPSFDDLRLKLPQQPLGVVSEGGWRLEDFVADLMLQCKAGLIDDSPNFESLVILMNQKQRPMSSALSITFDVP